MQLRVCTKMQGFNNGEDGYSRSLAHPWDKLLPIRLGSKLLSQHNVSLVYFSLKHPKNRHHRSCLTALANGVADVTTMNLPFSTVYDNGNLTQAPPRMQYDASFISMYKESVANKSPDMFDFVIDFPISTLIMTASFLIAIMILSQTVLGFEPRKRNRTCSKIWDYYPRLVWKILASTTGNWQTVRFLIPMRSLIMSVIILIATFRTICFMTMRTEKVVSTPPVKLDSIVKLIHYKVPFSYLGSYEFKVFQTSVDPAIRKIVSFSEGKHVWGVITETRVRRQLLDRLMHQKEVYILPYSISSVKIICQIATMNRIDLSGFGINRVPLHQVPHPLAGYIISSVFMRRNRSTGKLLVTAIRMSLEGDIIDSYENKLVAVLTKSTRVFDARHCNLSTGKLEPVLFRPSFESMEILMLICFIMLIIALFLYLSEKNIRKIVNLGN